MKHVKGVLVFCPAYGETTAAALTYSLYMVAQYLTSRRIENSFCWFSGADITEVRNLALTMWYDKFPGYSHLLMVDSDMGFPPELLDDMLKFDRPLVGTIYSKRKPGDLAIVGDPKPNMLTANMQMGFLPAESFGFGVVMMKRRVVEEMLKKLPDIEDRLPVYKEYSGFEFDRIIRAFESVKRDGVKLSEDMSFCHRWKQCGGELWINVRHKISHIGPMDYSLNYSELLSAYEKHMKEKAA